MFLVHDKRILGIVLAELDSLVVDHGVLSAEQAETMHHGRPAPDQPQYVLQQVIQQPNIELLNDKGSLCHQHVVGTGLFANGVFVGPGMCGRLRQDE